MKKLIDIVKSIETRFDVCWHEDFMEHAYSALLVVQEDLTYFTSTIGGRICIPSELDWDIVDEAENREIEEDEIKEAKTYIQEKYPTVIYMGTVNASHIIERERKQKVTPLLVDYSTDIFRDGELEEKRKSQINKVLDKIISEGHDFVYDNMCWGAQYDYNEIDITENLWLSIQLYCIDEDDIDIIKERLEKEAGCRIEIF